MKKNMIDPNNKRLKLFHLILGISVFIDFILTGLIIANYDLMSGNSN
jgi:hypothetical protein